MESQNEVGVELESSGCRALDVMDVLEAGSHEELKMFVSCKAGLFQLWGGKKGVQGGEDDTKVLTCVYV